MAGSEFDKHIKEIMDNRQFEPDDAVWSNIRGDIELRAKRKKRRLVILFGSVIMISSALFLLRQQSPIPLPEPSPNAESSKPLNQKNESRTEEKQSVSLIDQTEKNALPPIVKSNPTKSVKGNAQKVVILKRNHRIDPITDHIASLRMLPKPNTVTDSKAVADQTKSQPVLFEPKEFKEDSSALTVNLFGNNNAHDSIVQTCNPIDTVLLNKALARDRNRKHFYFGMKVGAIGFENYPSSNAISTDYNIAPSVGMLIGLWHANHQLSIEPEFIYRNNINVEKTFQVNDYGFGVTNKKNTITVTTARIIHLPLLLGYRTSSGHTIKAGLYSNIVIGGNSQVNYYISNETTRNESGRKQSGIPNGLNSFDFGFTASGQVKISPSSRLELKFIYGLMDQTPNAYYQKNVNDRNRGIQLNYIFNWH